MGTWNWKSFTSGLIVGSALLSTISIAAPAAVRLFVNGTEAASGASPQIIDGTAFVPARGLAEALGASVEWDEAAQAIRVETSPYKQLQAKNPAQLSPQAAVYLAKLAVLHYWHAAGGGGMSDGEIRTVHIPGRDYDYRWLGQDVSTKSAYIAYLEEVFTPEQATDYYNKQMSDGSLVEIGGKLAQPNADGGSMLEWEHAEVSLIQSGDGQRTYQFSVPLGEGEAGYEQRIIKLRFMDGLGWRLDVPVNLVR